ncbi:PREDICTED: uncharacterized protein LOC108569940 isoform X2 [Nicrophorus vespilloides]|uniref:Uncharacterized protein LOC108569940 isoform X2 n=1 Tax=Nicrophorus vespilloides TaxID=110193 RepID=A0ABM1NK45_NICVS|nr:PREDICTED: uncharacterized protein LOC108569940 isoform X2 [Nicrophorus vespilloides]
MDEQAMIEILSNQTSIDDSSIVMYKIHNCIELVLCFINLMSDLLIVTIMMKNKSVNTRTNKVIMHFAIADAFSMIDDLGLFYIIHEKITYHLSMNRLTCAFVIFQITSLCASLLFILLLLSNTLMKSARVSDKILILVYYGIIGLVFILEILFCAFLHRNFHVFHSVNFLIFATAVICLFVKEVNRLYKFWKKRPLSQNTAFRMNVARIFIYSLMVEFFSYGTNKFLLFFGLFGYLTGFLIILYLAYSDRNFKTCLLNLLTCRIRNYDADATIRFADECSETMDEIPDVNVTFNGNTTSLR